MTLFELQESQDEIISAIHQKPSDAYEVFLKCWDSISDIDDKRILATEIIKECDATNSRDGYELPLDARRQFKLRKLCCSKIAIYISDDLNGRPWFGTLKLGPGIADKEIAAVFKLLKDLKYIENTNQEISQVISRVIEGKESSFFSYLENPERKLKNAAIEFKKRVNDCAFVEERPTR
jgi:hypothetical protein